MNTEKKDTRPDNMNAVERFLVSCSGVDQSVLAQCPTDKNKYVGIGGTVLFTGILAFFSASYAIYTVFDTYFMAFLFGLIWGLMIFNLDRYIVSSMKSRGAWGRDFAVAFPRLLMAVLLALVISKPLELKIFEKEISAELIVMEQEVYKRQEGELTSRYKASLDEYKSQIATLQKEIDDKAALRDTLTQKAVAEADGTGGSKIRNMGPIYRAKKAEADKAQAELDATTARVLPLIEEKRRDMQQLEAQMGQEMSSIERLPYGGLAAQMEALDRLATESRAIWFANLFIMLLFIAIETAPIFVKLISSRSPYDYVLHQKEHTYEMAAYEDVALRNNQTKNKVKFDTETGVHRTQKEIEAEKELIDHHLEQKKAALKGNAVDWRRPLLESEVLK